MLFMCVAHLLSGWIPQDLRSWPQGSPRLITLCCRSLWFCNYQTPPHCGERVSVGCLRPSPGFELEIPELDWSPFFPQLCSEGTASYPGRAQSRPVRRRCPMYWELRDRCWHLVWPVKLRGGVSPCLSLSEGGKITQAGMTPHLRGRSAKPCPSTVMIILLLLKSNDNDDKSNSNI